MSQHEEDTESLDWGDGARYDDEDDREDVVSLVAGDDDIGPPTAQPDSASQPPAPYSARKDDPAAPASPAANKSLRERLSKPPQVSARLENSASFTSTISQSSSGSNHKLTLSSGLSTVSHPSLPPKPSAETTAAAEAARRRDEELKLQSQKSASAHKDSDLPPHWEAKRSITTGDVYYHNVKTDETTWEQPLSVPPRAKERRTLTPPRRTDDRERTRDKRTNESSDGHAARERGRDRDKPRERSRSGTPSRERRRREAELERSRRREGWDSWVPEKSPDYERRREGLDDRGRRTAANVSASSLPHGREDNASFRRKDSSRQGNTNEPPRDADKTRSGRGDSRRWSPSLEHAHLVPRDNDRDVSRDYERPRDTLDSIRPSHHVSDRQSDWDSRRHRSPDEDRNRYQPRRPSPSPQRVYNRRRSPTPDRRASHRESLSPGPIRRRSRSPTPHLSHNARTPDFRAHRSPQTELAPPVRQTEYNHGSDAHYRQRSPPDNEVDLKKRRGTEPDVVQSIPRAPTPESHEKKPDGIPTRPKRAPLPPQSTEFKQKRSAPQAEPSPMQGIPQGPKNWNGRPLPPKEPPVVPGAPSGPRGDRPVVPPGVKDASHPAFASQTRLPPSGPSRRGPPTSQPEAGEGNKAVPTGPRVRTTSAVSAVSSETERVASKQTPTLTGPPHHVPEVSAANLVRRAQIERERDEAIAQRDQEQTSRRNKRVASASPPPAKSRKISPSPNRQRFQSPSPAVPKRITGSNNVPVAKVRTFGKLDQAGNDNNTASRDITRDRDYHRMDVSDDYTASRPSFDLRNETGLPAAFPLLQHERNSSLYQPPANALSHSFNRPLNDHQANENQYRSRSIPTPTPVQIERERLPERRWGAQLRSNRDQSSGLPNNSYPGYDLRKPETTNRQDPAPPVSSAPWPSRSRGQTNGDFGLDLGEGSQRRPRDFQGPEISRAQAPELRDLVESRTTYSSILPPGYYIKNPDTYEVGLRLVSRRRSEEVILGSPRGESNRTGSLLDRIVRQGPPVIHSENGPVPLRDRITASGEVSPRAGEMDDSVRSDSGDEVNGTSGGGQGPNSGSGGRKRRKSRRKSARR